MHNSFKNMKFVKFNKLVDLILANGKKTIKFTKINPPPPFQITISTVITHTHTCTLRMKLWSVQSKVLQLNIMFHRYYQIKISTSNNTQWINSIINYSKHTLQVSTVHHHYYYYYYSLTLIVTFPLVTFLMLKPTVGIMSSLNWPLLKKERKEKFQIMYIYA